MTINTLTRQIRRAAERRVSKPEPETIERTSLRYVGRTKGLPYSRMMVHSITPSDLYAHRPAVFHLKHPTRRSMQSKVATRELIDTFMPNLPENMVQGMLGLH